MDKKAQVTVFIVVAVFIVVVVVMFFLLQGRVVDSGMGSEANRVYNFVQGCADEVYLDIIYSVGASGGYYDLSDEYISYGIPVYKTRDRIIAPEAEDIEKEIAKGFNEGLMNCARDFYPFPDLDIVEQPANSVAEMSDDEIVLSVSYPIFVDSNGRRDLLEDFGEIRVPLQMGLMYKIAYDIAESEDVESICLSCLAELADENNFKIDVIDYDADTVFFIISHEELNGRVFEFTFGMRK